MARFDLDEAALRAYAPEVRVEPDFDEFWADTLAGSRAAASAPRIERVTTALRAVEYSDVTFSGFAGDPVRAWYLRPAGTDEALPTVVEFVGYGGGRGAAHERLTWAAAGYAHLVMDSRGQGSSWGTGGATEDPHGTGPSVPGFMTRGIQSPETYYYRRLITDAVLSVDAAKQLPGVDASRIAVTGGSQGGGLALAVAGLRDDLAAAMMDVPFLSHFERAVGMTGRDPYAEIVRYLANHRGTEDSVFRTLSYVDGVNFARRAGAPALFSAALHDATCPPSTVFAAYNAYRGEKEITVYPYNDHEGGGPDRWPELARFAGERLTD